MKIKTLELINEPLDWAVAQAEGIALVDGCIFTKDPDDEQVLFSPSTNREQGGAIQERERIDLKVTMNGTWFAWHSGQRECVLNAPEYGAFGDTVLIAAMRCFVRSKLGDEVEIPESLS